MDLAYRFFSEKIAVVIVSGAAFTLYVLHVRATKPRGIPSSIPWVGCKEEMGSRTLANLREIKLGVQYLEEGYEKVRKPENTALLSKALFFSREGLGK